MKKFVLICLCLMLIGCNPDVSGNWLDTESQTELSFEDDTVMFFGIEGSYDLKNNKIMMTFDTMTLEYEYDIKNDQLILYLGEDELILERTTK